MSYILYDHQENVIDNVSEYLMFDGDRAFIDGSVSVGKTYISLGLADEIIKTQCTKNEKVYIVVSISALIEQFINTAQDMGIKISVIAAGVKSPEPDAQIVVAMEQTLISRVDKLNDECYLYLRDEVHLAYNTQAQKKLFKKLGVKKFVGLSGSLFDKKGNHLDPNVKTFVVKELAQMIEDGDVKNIVYVDSRDEELTESFEYKQGDSEDEIGREVIDKADLIVSTYFKKNKKLENKKTIWFCPNTSAADKIAKVLRERGIVAYSYHSNNTGEDKRLQEVALRSFKSDKMTATKDPTLLNAGEVEMIMCDNIVTVNSLSTGFSVDNIEVGVLTSPIGSKNAYIQRGGRTIRKDDVVEKAYIVDMHGNVLRYGKLEKLHTDVDQKILKELTKRDGVTIDNMDKEIVHLAKLLKYDDKYSLLELKDQISLFRMMSVSSDIVSISDYLALTMSIVKEIHGETYEVELYRGGTKTVKNWYKPSTVMWIMEDFEFLYKVIENDYVKEAMSAMFRSKCKQIVNQKKNIYGLKFCYSRMPPMLDYFMEKGLYIDKDERDVIGVIEEFCEGKENQGEESYVLNSDDDEVPF